MSRLRSAVLVLSAALAAAASTVPPVQAEPSPVGAQLAAARAATAQYHQLSRAQDAGYGELRDAAGIACIDNPGSGAMGIHFVKGALVGDGTVDASTPEAVIYEPQADGSMQLVAVEYVVLAADWQGTSAPSLFGLSFELVPSPNRYGLPPFYELHAWLWRHNPAGMFEDFNPQVSCAAA